MTYEDIDKVCVDCHQNYTITAGEQEFFDKKGFLLPKRCKPCRKLKTKEMNKLRGNGTELNQKSA